MVTRSSVSLRCAAMATGLFLACSPSEAPEPSSPNQEGSGAAVEEAAAVEASTAEENAEGVAAAPDSQPEQPAVEPPAEAAAVEPQAEAEAEAAAPSGTLEPIQPTAHQPCTIVIEPGGSSEQMCFSIEQLRVAGQPVDVCAQSDPHAYTYNEQGRLISDGWRQIRHLDDGTSVIAGIAEETSAVTFDEAGRFLTFGESTYRYDSHGRLTRREAEGMFDSVMFAADGTSTSDHNYPDSDEFCVADITAVEGDPLQPTMQRVEHCEINEVPRTVRYTRDAYGRVVGFTVDAHHDGTIDATGTVTYDCHAG